MTTQTIRNGTSIDVPIPTGQTLKVVAVTGTYTITVTRGTGIGTALATAATGGSYGAYAYDSVVRIVASSASEIDFDVAVTPVVDSDTEPKFAFDSTGAVTGLVGPGGVLRGTYGIGKRIINAAIAGDSMAWMYSNFTAGSNASAVGYQNSWVAQTLNQLGNFVRVPASYITAVSGQSTSHLVVTQLPAILALSPLPDVVFLNVGSNDIFISDLDVDVLQANVSYFLREMARVGIDVVMIDGTPRANTTVGTSTYTSAKDTKWQAYKDWIGASLPSRFPMHRFVKTYSLGDTSTSSLYDGLHPTTTYAIAMGKAVAANIAAKYQQGLVSAPAGKSDYIAKAGVTTKQCLSAVGIGGAVGDTSLPAAWARHASSTNSAQSYLVVAHRDGLNALQLTVTFTAAGQLFNLDCNESFTAGTRELYTDNVYGSCLLDISGGSCLAQTCVNALVSPNAVTNYNFTVASFIFTGTVNDTTGISLPDGAGMRMVTPEITANNTAVASTNANAHRFRLALQSGSAGTAVVTLREPCIWKV